MDKEFAFQALVGSHNYNLNDENSDKDYKVFVLPDFNDLYHGKMYSNKYDGEKADYDFHDIRKMVNLFWKSNLNFIEVLYSKELIMSKDETVKKYVDQILNMKHDIVTMNLPYLFKACKGMYFNKNKHIKKGTSSTEHLVEKYGYDTKAAMSTYRILEFLNRFATTDFEDFKYAMEYDSREREVMLGIKNGGLKLDEFQSLLGYYLMNLDDLEKTYMKHEPNENAKGRLESLVYELVKEKITR